MALTIQERTGIIKLAVGMFNAAPGAIYLNEISALFEASGRSLGNVAAGLSNSSAYQLINPSSQTALEFAASFLTPLGLQSNTEAVAFVVARLGSGASKGAIVVEAINALDSTSSAVFADAKAILNNKTAVAENFSVTLARTDTSLTLLKAAIDTVTKDLPSVAAAIAFNTSGGVVVPPPVVFNVVGTAVSDNLMITAASDNVQALAGNDTITLSTASIATLTGTIDGGPDMDTLVLSVPAVNISTATLISVENLKVTVPGTTTLTASQFNAFTTINSAAGLGEIATLTTSGIFNIGARANDSVGFDTINLAAGANTINLTGAVTAGLQTINGGVGSDSFTSNALSLLFRTLNGGDGSDSLNVVDQLFSVFGLASNAIEVYNIGGIAPSGLLIGSDGAGVVYNISGASFVAPTINLMMGTGGQTVNSTTTGSIAYMGGSGADTFNLGAAAERIDKSGSTFSAIDTVVNFKAAGADTFRGVAAATSLNVLNIATSDISSLAANIQTAAVAAGAALASNTQAYVINVAAGAAAGQYAFQNTGTAMTSVDSSDFIVKLTGTVGSILVADFTL